jgi:hypothetical protein
MRLALIVRLAGKVAQNLQLDLSTRASVDIGVSERGEATLTKPSLGDARLRVASHALGVTLEALEGAWSVGGVPLRHGRPRLVQPPVWFRVFDVEGQLDHDDESTREAAFRMAAQCLAPRVTIAEGEGCGTAFPLLRDTPCVIGRGYGVHAFLADTAASRRHASVIFTGDRVLVIDHGSAAGTYLAGARLMPEARAEWPADRMLVIGRTVLALTGIPFENEPEQVQQPSSPIEEPTPVAEIPEPTPEVPPEPSSPPPPPPPRDSFARNVALATAAFLLVVGLFIAALAWIFGSASSDGN